MAIRRRFGYRRLHILLRREGTHVNRKKLRRLMCVALETEGMRPVDGPLYQPRSAISRLVSEIARAGLSPLGQVLVQFMMVWQR